MRNNVNGQNRVKIAVLGADGFLGGELCDHLRENYDVCGITRKNYYGNVGKQYDIFINANGNSRRHWANKNILEDFEVSTASVYKTFFDFKTGLYIYVSSSDVYPCHDDPSRSSETSIIDPKDLAPYGFHKYLSESMVRKYAPLYLILRCSAFVGKDMKKGAVWDLMEQRPLFVTMDSRLQFISASEISDIIKGLIAGDVFNDTFNVGGIGAVSLRDLANSVNKDAFVQAEAERQVYEMDVSKLKKIYPLKSSAEYIQECIDVVRIGKY